MNKSFSVFCDGGSRGNPGPAAVGYIIRDAKGKTLTKHGHFIGRATNNVAEYTAVIKALKWISRNYSITQSLNYSITFFLDSKLVVNQLNGLFKIKNSGLRELAIQVRQLEREIGGNITYRFVPREKNRDADSLVNQVLNEV